MSITTGKHRMKPNFEFGKISGPTPAPLPAHPPRVSGQTSSMNIGLSKESILSKMRSSTSGIFETTAKKGFSTGLSSKFSFGELQNDGADLKEDIVAVAVENKGSIFSNNNIPSDVTALLLKNHMNSKEATLLLREKDVFRKEAILGEKEKLVEQSQALVEAHKSMLEEREKVIMRREEELDKKEKELAQWYQSVLEQLALKGLKMDEAKIESKNTFKDGEAGQSVFHRLGRKNRMIGRLNQGGSEVKRKKMIANVKSQVKTKDLKASQDEAEGGLIICEDPFENEDNWAESTLDPSLILTEFSESGPVNKA